MFVSRLAYLLVSSMEKKKGPNSFCSVEMSLATICALWVVILVNIVEQEKASFTTRFQGDKGEGVMCTSRGRLIRLHDHRCCYMHKTHDQRSPYIEQCGVALAPHLTPSLLLGSRYQLKPTRVYAQVERIALYINRDNTHGVLHWRD